MSAVIGPLCRPKLLTLRSMRLFESLTGGEAFHLAWEVACLV
jgi:hypothetical protein